MSPMVVDRLEILKKMIRIRMVEQYIASRYPEQKMRCPAHLCIGQEAVPAVYGYFAHEKDIFVGTCRSHGHYLAKGGNLTALFAELLGSPRGCSKGFGGSMHIIDLKRNFWGTSAIVAGGIPIAAGAAFGFKYKQEPNVVVVFFGDAAMEEGVVYETVNFSLLNNLPVIFVCENNRLAVTTPLELRQSSTLLYNRFQTMGMRGFYVEENDIGKLIDVAQKSYEFARNGQGPSFVEYSVTRWSIHVGHEFSGPVDSWWQEPAASEKDFCPICVLMKELLDEGSIDIPQIQKLRQGISEEIEEAYKEVGEKTEFPKKDLAEFVYASPLESKLPQLIGKLDKKFKYMEQSKLVNPF